MLRFRSHNAHPRNSCRVICIVGFTRLLSKEIGGVGDMFCFLKWIAICICVVDFFKCAMDVLRHSVTKENCCNLGCDPEV